MGPQFPLSPATPAFSINSNSSSYFAPQSASSTGAGFSNGTLSSTGRNHQRDSSNNGASGLGTASAVATPGATTPRANIVGNLLPNGGGPDPDSAPQENMFLCLQDLFLRIQNHSKKTQYFTPTAFVAKVKKENGKDTTQYMCSLSLVVCLSVVIIELNFSPVPYQTITRALQEFDASGCA